MMHYPGVPSATSMQVLTDLSVAIATSRSKVNDTTPGITYSAGQWTTAGNRNAGDYQKDVSYATANGASFEYAFTGSGIDVVGPASGATTADVYIDGAKVSTISRTDAGYTPQTTLASVTGLAPGVHTLKVVKTGGQYFQLDALSITGMRLNNTATGITSSAGQWTTAGNRNAGDYQNDVRWASANGASIEFGFVGTGIQFVGPAAGTTMADVFIDGLKVATINRTDAGYVPQVALATVNGLAAGPHTLKLVKTGGQYLQLDALQVTIG